MFDDDQPLWDSADDSVDEWALPDDPSLRGGMPTEPPAGGGAPDVDVSGDPTWAQPATGPDLAAPAIAPVAASPATAVNPPTAASPPAPSAATPTTWQTYQAGNGSSGISALATQPSPAPVRWTPTGPAMRPAPARSGCLAGPVALVIMFVVIAFGSNLSNYLSDNNTSGIAWVDADSAQAAGLLTVSVAGYDADGNAFDNSSPGLLVSTDGLLVVPYHLVAGTTDVTVTTQAGESATATVVGFDLPRDVAVLSAPDLAGTPAATLASKVPASDEPVSVLSDSSPDGVAAVAATSIGSDAIDADVDDPLGRYVATVSTEVSLADVSDVPGAPVLDNLDQVVGIDLDGQGAVLPIETVRSVLKTVEAGRDSGTVRVGPAGDLGMELSPQSRSEDAVPEVMAVNVGGAAQAAKIAVGDTILDIDGKPVPADPDISMIGQIRMLEPGTKVKVTVLPPDESKPRTVKLTVGESQVI